MRLLPLLLLAACTRAEDDDDTVPSSTVTPEELGAQLRAWITESHGFDPDELGAPEVPQVVLDRQDVAAVVNDGLDTLARATRATSLELDTPPQHAATRSLRAESYLGSTCTPWEDVSGTPTPTVLIKVYEATCGELLLRLTSSQDTHLVTWELWLDGVSGDGTVHSAFVPYRSLWAVEEDGWMLTQAGEQNPPDPAPWWESVHAGVRVSDELSVDTWTTTTWVWDGLLEDHHPWQRTVFNGVPGAMTIEADVWSPQLQSLYLWLLYVFEGTRCEVTEFDQDGTLVSTDAC